MPKEFCFAQIISIRTCVFQIGNLFSLSRLQSNLHHYRQSSEKWNKKETHEFRCSFFILSFVKLLPTFLNVKRGMWKYADEKLCWNKKSQWRILRKKQQQQHIYHLEWVDRTREGSPFKKKNEWKLRPAKRTPSVTEYKILKKEEGGNVIRIDLSFWTLPILKFLGKGTQQATHTKL